MISELPLVTVTYPDEFSDEELADAIRRQAELIEEGPNVAFLADFGKVPVRAKHRHHLAGEMDRVEEVSRRHLVAVALVARSSIVRRGIIAMRWLKPAVFPFAMFGNAEDARRWLRDRIREYVAD